jgi:uncharacterized membrane-anchored protein
VKIARVVIFLVVALLQLSVPAAAVWNRVQTLKHGRVWKFKTAPVDPVDAIRGRYIALRFEAEEIPLAQKLEAADFVYGVLKEDENGFAEIDHFSTAAVAGDNVIKVETGWWREGKQRVRFPFDRFWVAEKHASAAEKAYTANSNREKRNAYVTVRLHGGDAAIEQLYIDNVPLRKYLREHPQK